MIVLQMYKIMCELYMYMEGALISSVDYTDCMQTFDCGDQTKPVPPTVVHSLASLSPHVVDVVMYVCGMSGTT